MALILGIDRFMSECRSLTNFIGNAVEDRPNALGRLDQFVRGPVEQQSAFVHQRHRIGKTLDVGQGV